MALFPIAVSSDNSEGRKIAFNGGTVVTVSDNAITSIVHKTRSPFSFKDLEVINTTQEV